MAMQRDMAWRYVTGIAFMALLLAVQSGCGRGERHAEHLPRSGQCCSRIVSLSPSITEILFALGLGDRVAGVTRFCKYPPEARKKPVVGGYYDPDYEAIIRLHADLIIMLPEHAASRKNIESLGAAVLVVDHTTIEGMLRSIREIGAKCGVARKARDLDDSLRLAMARIEKKTRGLPRPRVLVTIGRGMASGSPDNLFIAGKGTMYDEFLTLAGGVNAWQGSGAQFPQVSLEGIYTLDPDIIIDMAPDLRAYGLTREKIAAEWKKADRVKAVANQRVYLLEDDFVTIPGPRIAKTLEQMARAIHPEGAWE
jgi:iron complex transport system substrate-binding protein